MGEQGTGPTSLEGLWEEAWGGSVLPCHLWQGYSMQYEWLGCTLATANRLKCEFKNGVHQSWCKQDKGKTEMAPTITSIP